jgi:hypothetical protein
VPPAITDFEAKRHFASEGTIFSDWLVISSITVALACALYAPAGRQQTTNKRYTMFGNTRLP